MSWRNVTSFIMLSYLLHSDSFFYCLDFGFHLQAGLGSSNLPVSLLLSPLFFLCFHWNNAANKNANIFYCKE